MGFERNNCTGVPNERVHASADEKTIVKFKGYRFVQFFGYGYYVLPLQLEFPGGGVFCIEKFYKTGDEHDGLLQEILQQSVSIENLG